METEKLYKKKHPTEQKRDGCLESRWSLVLKLIKVVQLDNMVESLKLFIHGFGFNYDDDSLFLLPRIRQKAN